MTANSRFGDAGKTSTFNVFRVLAVFFFVKKTIFTTPLFQYACRHFTPEYMQHWCLKLLIFCLTYTYKILFYFKVLLLNFFQSMRLHSTYHWQPVSSPCPALVADCLCLPAFCVTQPSPFVLQQAVDTENGEAEHISTHWKCEILWSLLEALGFNFSNDPCPKISDLQKTNPFQRSERGTCIPVTVKRVGMCTANMTAIMFTGQLLQVAESIGVGAWVLRITSTAIFFCLLDVCLRIANHETTIKRSLNVLMWTRNCGLLLGQWWATVFNELDMLTLDHRNHCWFMKYWDLLWADSS